MALGFAVLLGLPTLAWVADLLYPERRILSGEALAGYFFGVLAAFLAVIIAT